MGAEKTWCGGVDCTSGAGDVCQSADPFRAQCCTGVGSNSMSVLVRNTVKSLK